MVKYFRVGTSRLYVSEGYQQRLENARAAFVPIEAFNPGAEVDVAADLGKGTLIVFPSLSGDAARFLLGSAPSALDGVNAATPHVQIALFSSTGAMRPNEFVRVSGGLVSDDGTLYVGTPSETVSPTWSLNIPRGAAIGVAGSSVEIDLSTLADNAAKLFVDPEFNYAVIPAEDGRRKIVIDLIGPSRGAFRFPLMLDDFLLGRLGTGPRYFDTREIDEGMLVPGHLSYPLYSLGVDVSEIFRAQFDFAAPQEENAATGVEAAVFRPRSLLVPTRALRSHVHAVHGHEVELEADEGTAGFVLRPSPELVRLGDGSASIQRNTHYFAPFGGFAVTLRNSDATEARLSMGLSNLETLTVKTLRHGSGGDRLYFERDRAAFGGILPPSMRAIEAVGDPGPLYDLSRTCLTSWVRLQLSGMEAAVAEPMSLQPEGMQAYRAMEGAPGVMAFNPLRYPNATQAFPFVPLLGVRGGGDEEAKILAKKRLLFERDVLARARRMKIIGSIGVEALVARAAVEAVDLEVGRTPQGFMASRSGTGGSWTSLQFTRTSKRADDKGVFTELHDVGIEADIGNRSAGLLAQALSHNRLMLVTRWSKLKELGFKLANFEKLHIGGWGVSLLPVAKDDDKADPFVVLKFDDRALRNLAEDTNQWTLAQDFCSGDPKAFQIDLLKLLPGAETTEDLLTPLARRVNDPNWNGMLILDARLPLDGIPDQMRAIAGGLPDRLPVSYSGLDISGIDPRQPEAEPWRSAIFGLVKHVNPTAVWQSDEDSGVAMRVPRLILRVENDAVDRFECTVELKIPKLFDFITEEPTKILTLEGRYEARVSNGKRQDTYTFTSSGQFTKKFSADSVVNQVTLQKIRLITVANAGDRTQGRFLIDGDIKFNQISGFDLLGIDNLDFTDLAIDLDFLIGSIRNFKLGFNYPNLRFDLERFNRGDGRRGGVGSSFLRSFPLKLRGLRVGDFSLPTLGYIGLGGLGSVGSVQFADDFKFGLDFDLDLGSLGALAKKLDRFKLQFAIGWKPIWAGGNFVANHVAAGFRLDLGEGAGGIDLGLQGIMRITAERFNLKKEGEIIILSADDCHLEVLGKRLPGANQKFSMFLFANLGGNSPFEQPGWYASFRDTAPEAPVKIETVILAQRVDVNLSTIKSTRETLAWLNKQEKFEGPDGARDFVQFAKPGGHLKYDPGREWFIAFKGDFFDVFRLGVLLKDPDVYGAYVGLLAKDEDPGAALMSFDLLYQKMADGLGRYVVEVGLPPGYRTIEVGAASLTIGLVRFEIYSDGGFLVDLGFPEYVDYSRSFAVQAGVFIGKGGLYFGRVPAVTVPGIPAGYGQIIRAGFALRVGLGREFEKGPIRAGLSLSVFGRMEGYFAAAARPAPGTEVVAPYPYWMRIQGEIGIIAEIEGSVDLQLIRARLLVRVWIAAGIVLETNLPVLLYCEAGVSIALEFEIGSFSVFGHRVSISITLRFSTTLRFEFTLPARVPVFGKRIESAIESMPRLTDIAPWNLPTVGQLGVAASPMDLRLGYDLTRADREGAPKVVLVPMVMWVEGDELNKTDAGPRPPFADLARALISWAALRCSPSAENAQDIMVFKGKSTVGAIAIDDLERAIRGLEAVPFDLLDSFLKLILQGTRLRNVVEISASGHIFPVPPNLRLERLHGGENLVFNFAQLGKISEADLETMFEQIERQFAELDRRNLAATTEAMDEYPLVSHLFRSWCGALALSAIDVARTTWVPANNEGESFKLGAVLNLIEDKKWTEVAARAGRLLLGGLRVPSPEHAIVPLLDRAGLLIDLPVEGATEIELVDAGATSWLAVERSSLRVEGERIAALATAPVLIDFETDRPASVRLISRAFIQHPVTRIKIQQSPATVALLSRFSSDFSNQLRGMAFKELKFSAKIPAAQPGQSGLDKGIVLQSPRPSLMFEMVLERVAAGRSEVVDGAIDATPIKYIPGAFQIAGTSEVERLPLDSLFALQPGEIRALLKQSELQVGYRQGQIPDEHLILITPTGFDFAQIVIARSTVSVERRPFIAEAIEIEPVPENIFRATLDQELRFELLYLLQRSAIVNSGGTYLIVPTSISEPLEQLFESAEVEGGERSRVRLMFVLTFADGVEPPSGAVNAVLFTGPDVTVLDPAEIGEARAVVAQLSNLPNPEGIGEAGEQLIEAISLRPPGTELVRVWRRRVKAAAHDGLPNSEELGRHLAARFEMLEFELTDTSSARRQLLSYDDSLPLASEEAIPKKGYPEQMRSWLQAEKPAGYKDDDLRYDLLVPVSRLVGPEGGAEPSPYDAIGRTFELGISWRDLYGNRLLAPSQTIVLEPRYTDPLVPLSAWPCLKARVYPGAPGSRALTFELTVDVSAIPSNGDDKRILVKELRRVIHQLQDRRVTVEVSSGLGRIENPKVDRSVVDDFLVKLCKGLLSEGDVELPRLVWSTSFTIAVDTSQAFLEVSLAFIIERDTLLVGGAIPGKGSRTIPGVKRVQSPVRITPISEPAKEDMASAARQFATDFQPAFEFVEDGEHRKYWVARGEVMRGDSKWWAVDHRLIPEADTTAPALAFAPPPLARALMSSRVKAAVVARMAESDVEYAQNSFAKSEQKEQVIEAIDLDADGLMAAFLDRIETFLSGAHAPVTALATADPADTANTDHATPFERVARAKADLLDVNTKGQPPLLRGITPVFSDDRDAPEALRAAMDELRDCCAIHLQRFYDVACVVVKPLRSSVKPGWIKEQGTYRPKLYGQLRFHQAEGSTTGFRAMTRGIPLDSDGMQIAISVIADTLSEFIDLTSQGPVTYELTHIEREVLGSEGSEGRLAPSRWLSIVPLLAAEGAQLPQVVLAQPLPAPMLRRRVPKLPELERPTVSLYDDDTPPANYADNVRLARRWTYGFDVAAEFSSNDEVCGRLIYNAPLGSGHLNTETPAEPRFPGLFEALVAHEHEVMPYWKTVLAEGARRANLAPQNGLVDPEERFRNACNRFAESVERVIREFTKGRTESVSPPIAEDRFVLTDKVSDSGGRKTTIEFVDHLKNGESWHVVAGEGEPWLRIRQIKADGSRGPESPRPRGGLHGGLGHNPVGGSFEFPSDGDIGLVRRREVQIGRLDALCQQSVWVAASVRRNNMVNGRPIQASFVYRTAEVYLQELITPNLRRRALIALEVKEQLTLKDLLLLGLQPVFDGVSGVSRSVHLRVDYESGQMVDLIEMSFGTVADEPGEAFVPEPDPKVMLTGLSVSEKGDPDWSVARLADELSNRLKPVLTAEPIGKRSDQSRGRLVLNITISASEDGRPGQPILRLERLGLDLKNVSDI